MIRLKTYKQKYRALIVITLLLAWVIYSFALQRTLSLAASCRDLQEEMEHVGSLDERVKELSSQVRQLDALLGSSDTTGKDFSRLILEKAGSFCENNGITLTGMPRENVTEKEGHLVTSNVVVVEGDYCSLLDLVYHIEQVWKLPGLAAADFYSVADLRSGTSTLKVKLYLQNVRKKV
ncbi:MAG: hypothetical protein JXA03_10530 [Bacteroidales bacterium]|nr:hypothetical protein [Bacteroidales bacterium]